MNIPIKYIKTNYGIHFVRSGILGLRMWLYDRDALWYRTVGKYCPHLNYNNSECLDCALVLESSDE